MRLLDFQVELQGVDLLLQLFGAEELFPLQAIHLGVEVGGLLLELLLGDLLRRFELLLVLCRSFM